MNPVRWRWLVTLSCVVLAAATTGWLLHRQEAGLSARLSGVVDTKSARRLSCAELAPPGSRVVLVLGQSMAGNHGPLVTPSLPPIRLLVNSDCFLANDPISGSTGHGGSIWSRLPNALAQLGVREPIVISAMGIDATTIDDWTRSRSALRSRLLLQLREMVVAGLKPDLVLWQQGEADAQRRTSASEYSSALSRLAGVLREAGVDSPILLAKSTRCRSEPNIEIRLAIDQVTKANSQFRLGPDTDALEGEVNRLHGCHLTVAGMEAAARMWASVIAAAH